MGMGILDTTGHWGVNGTPIYIPSYNMQIDHESIQGSDSGRTEDGYMHIDWVRTNLVKVFLKWQYLTGREVEYLENLMQGKEFTLTYFDKGSVHTAKVYCTKLSYTKYSDALYVSEGGLYSNISADAIEL